MGEARAARKRLDRRIYPTKGKLGKRVSISALPKLSTHTPVALKGLPTPLTRPVSSTFGHGPGEPFNIAAHQERLDSTFKLDDEPALDCDPGADMFLPDEPVFMEPAELEKCLDEHEVLNSIEDDDLDITTMIKSDGYEAG
ncbi:uncharacterized protein RHO25_002749 [Cercospora beticola]|uniref:Uncharacterized protein n=2 Tax=Cercospora TaxID=29002 RepID=A0ABZ0NF22_CERBT|nr:uncharacterized protein CKM354_000155200 [Cercospora kikuchii]WPA98138.1 hypothetical protein RHO25_002749 [Cercospora beticola]GIZ38129.1 hypothetical protein CKM354_000155200 [Cercospora kikuchii]